VKLETWGKKENEKEEFTLGGRLKKKNLRATQEPWRKNEEPASQNLDGEIRVRAWNVERGT